jgi:hypothetical protein
MYVYRVIKSLGLNVELLMLTEIDNSGACDLANGWSMGGRTRHIDVHMFYLHKLKEEGMVSFKHIPRPKNEANILTKNVDSSSLHRHSAKLCGEDRLLAKLKGEKP